MRGNRTVKIGLGDSWTTHGTMIMRSTQTKSPTCAHHICTRALVYYAVSVSTQSVTSLILLTSFVAVSCFVWFDRLFFRVVFIGFRAFCCLVQLSIVSTLVSPPPPPPFGYHAACIYCASRTVYHHVLCSIASSYFFCYNTHQV